MLEINFKSKQMERDNCKKRTRGYEKFRRQLCRDAGKRCVYCGSQDNLTIDHVIPQKLGGSDDLANLVTCCKSCNSRKNARLGHAIKYEMNRYKSRMSETEAEVQYLRKEVEYCRQDMEKTRQLLLNSQVLYHNLLSKFRL